MRLDDARLFGAFSGVATVASAAIQEPGLMKIFAGALEIVIHGVRVSAQAVIP